MGNGRQQRRPQNPSSRVFDSQGPDGRVKGTPAQLYDRYKNAAREVQGSDRILAESLMQFADHYYRLSADGQDQPNADRSRRDGDDVQDNRDSRGPTGGENGEQPEEQAASAAVESQNGRDVEQSETESRVTEDQIPFLRQRGRPTSEKPAGLADTAPSMEAGTMDGTGVMANGEDKPAPRRRGRPRKTEAAEPSATPDGSAEIEKPKRRGPGRPRKSETLSAESAAPDEEEKPVRRRGPGRPRKTDIAAPAADGDAVS